ncbi:MAG: tripartite tricarboxylate transporter substrate-binding protein, partial [Polaromonas sp.]
MNSNHQKKRRHAMKRRDFALGIAGAILIATSTQLLAQAWPDKPIKWVLSQPPGSGPDNVARLLSDRLARSWGQSIVIDNKPGGQNIIGAQTAARSAADGYSFYFATTAALITNPLLFKQLSYDPQKDFVPVAFIARSPFALLVKGDSPIKTVEELIARSKADQGNFS